MSHLQHHRGTDGARTTPTIFKQTLGAHSDDKAITKALEVFMAKDTYCSPNQSDQRLGFHYDYNT